MAGIESLQAVSEGLADAVEQGAAGVVTVDARRRLAATGIAWSEDVVLTARHVLERDERIAVVLPDGTRAEATLAGHDHGTDIAVLRVEGATLTPAQRAEGTPRVGSIAIALGRPDGDTRASLGIITRVGGAWRTFRGGTVEGFLQSDAEMLPGFSGGPLVNAAGEVMAMTSSQLGRGAGMAIPLSAAAPIVEQLLSQGRLRRAYLGISTQPARLPDALAAKAGGQEVGLLITGVEGRSPAERGGMLMGDILVKLGDGAVDGIDALQAQLGGERVGQELAAVVLRAGEPLELSVTPGERGG